MEHDFHEGSAITHYTEKHVVGTLRAISDGENGRAGGDESAQSCRTKKRAAHRTMEKSFEESLLSSEENTLRL